MRATDTKVVCSVNNKVVETLVRLEGTEVRLELEEASIAEDNVLEIRTVGGADHLGLDTV